MAVLGAGTMGAALAHVVAADGRPCAIWCDSADVSRAINEYHRHPRFFSHTPLAPSLVATTEMGAAIREATVIVVATASGTFRAVAEALGPVAHPDQLLLSATKGFDPHSHRRMSELLRSHTSARNVGAIGGVNNTADIMAGHLSGLLVATPSKAAQETASRALQTSRLRVSVSDDLVGVELVSALKNIAAIAVGIANGQGLGINTVSFVLTRAFQEVGQMVVAMGGTPTHLLDLCGVGDLYLTCVHAGSLNRRVGLELGRGRTLAEIQSELVEVPEGINTVRVAFELARSMQLKLPILEAVHAIIRGEAPPNSIEIVLARE